VAGGFAKCEAAVGVAVAVRDTGDRSWIVERAVGTARKRCTGRAPPFTILGAQSDPESV